MTSFTRINMPRRRGEHGQMAVTSILFLIAMIGAAALIVDGGHWLHERRAAQGTADAAALAAVREVVTGGSPQAVASQYVNLNGQEDMSLQSVTVANGKVTVVVNRTSASFLAGTLGILDADIQAKASAQAMQPGGGIAGSLPFAFMTGQYHTGTNEAIKVDSNLGPGNRGTIRLPMEPNCSLGQGANDLKSAIDYGACAAPVGSTIQTETGNNTGPIKQALEDRIGSNTQSFSDVFQLDSTIGRYIVKDINSPRLGVVPVIETPAGGTTWPGGAKSVVIKSYLLVYIGKTSQYPYPAYTEKDKTVWVTPVRAVLPDELEALMGGTFNPNNDSPVSFRLVD